MDKILTITVIKRTVLVAAAVTAVVIANRSLNAKEDVKKNS